jgi:hypothetical protein
VRLRAHSPSTAPPSETVDVSNGGTMIGEQPSHLFTGSRRRSPETDESIARCRRRLSRVRETCAAVVP